MEHAIYRITQVECLEGFTIKVTFDDGLERVIDLEPVLAGKIYGPLRDPEIFREVKVDAEVQTVVWPNGADFDPETLHDWPKFRQTWMERAQVWRAASV